MFNVGAGEMIVIFMLALIVLGPDKLPSAARQAGKYYNEFRRISDGFQRELRDAMDVADSSSTATTTATSTTTATATGSSEATDSASAVEVPSPPRPTSPLDRIRSSDGAVTSGADVPDPEAAKARIIESANGPTLPPLLEPPSLPVADTDRAKPGAAGPASSPIDVDGPSSSFG